MKHLIITLTLALAAMTATAQAMPLDSIMAMKPADGLWYAMEYYDLYEPHVVYAQAVLETGHFRSALCVRHGNLFGIYDSRARQYRHYGHWIESVRDYRDLVQSKYRGGDYIEFLRDLPYATDTAYISKITRLAERYVQYD